MTHRRTLRTIVVDDEPLARQGVRQELDAVEDVILLAECGNGEDAVRAIREHVPDLVFLDIELPDLSGFEILELLDPETIPAVVFVTAFDHYAVRAFDAHAVDYVLKPLDSERFHEALERVRNRIAAHDVARVAERIAPLAIEDRRRRGFPTRLVIRKGSRLVFVPVDLIDRLEASDNYVHVFSEGKSHLLRGTLASLEARLDPDHFIRVHRSHMVRIESIQEVERNPKGDSVLVLRDGSRVPGSRRYRHHLERALDE